jgi:hypothetical protein
MVQLTAACVNNHNPPFVLAYMKPEAWDDERMRRRFKEYLKQVFPGYEAIPVRYGQKGKRRYYANKNIVAYIESVGFDRLPWRTRQLGDEGTSFGNELGERITERLIGEAAKRILAAIFRVNIPPGA